MSESAAPAVLSLPARLGAEAIGTFFLVFAVIGTALFSAGSFGGQGGPDAGFPVVAVVLGSAVVLGALAFGPVSGGHFNPAVTIGLAAAGRFSWKDVAGYVLAQVTGGILGAAALTAILAGGRDGALAAARRGGFASTGWGELSPGGYGIGAFFVAEIVATALFVTVILAVTGRHGAGRLAPVAVGLTLTVIALAAIPVTNGSFNPARSIATAVFGGGAALAQLWASIVAPAAGGLIAGLAHRAVFNADTA